MLLIRTKHLEIKDVSGLQGGNILKAGILKRGERLERLLEEDGERGYANGQWTMQNGIEGREERGQRTSKR